MSVQFSAVSAPAELDPARSGKLPALGDLAVVAALLRPQGPARPRWVVFGADHGIAAASVSPELPPRTGERLAALAGGVGPLSALAAAAGVGIAPVDLRDPAPDHPDNAWGGYQPSSRIDTQDALTDGEVVQAVQAGVAAADAEADSGADLLIGAVCSVAASTAVAVLAAAITGMEPVDSVTRGGGIDDAAWIRKTAAVRDALYRAKLAGTDAVTLLRVAGGADLAALTGFLAQAGVRGGTGPAGRDDRRGLRHPGPSARAWGRRVDGRGRTAPSPQPCTADRGARSADRPHPGHSFRIGLGRGVAGPHPARGRARAGDARRSGRRRLARRAAVDAPDQLVGDQRIERPPRISRISSGARAAMASGNVMARDTPPITAGPSRIPA